MKFVPAGLGAEPKKLALLGAILVVAGVVYWINSGPNIPEGAKASSAAALKVQPAPAVAPRPTSVSSAPRPATRGGRPPNSADDFRPTPKLPEGLDISRVDPTLKLDLLGRVREVSVESGSRSLFEFYTPPPPPPPKVTIVPTPAPKIADGKQTEAPKVAQLPPPPPPIPLKFYGLSGGLRSTIRRAFFLDGEDIILAHVGMTVKGRWLVVQIGSDSVMLEDAQTRKQQPLAISEEAGAGSD